MPETDLFVRLALALGLGLIIGVERGWHGRDRTEGERIAGIRTFALVGLLGGVCGWIADLTTPVFPAAAGVALGVLLAVSYWLRLRDDDDLGLTTEVALLLTFALGVAAALGPPAPAAAAAVVAATLLSMKPRLHGWLRAMDRPELTALLRLALISVVVLPLLPDQGYGPGSVLNPYELWWAVVVVAGLSFLGYEAIRLAGPRLGVLATGLFGGLASSTSTTLALARLVRTGAAPAPLAAAGIVVAGSVTFLRILALTAVFGPALVVPLTPPMVAMAAVGFAGAALVHLRDRDGPEAPTEIDGVGNPLELTSALAFGAVLAVVLLGVHHLREWLGDAGVHAAAALSGLTDVDALTISVSRLVGEDLPTASGVLAIFIAVAVNTGVKAGISVVAGDVRLGLRVVLVNAAAILAGVAALLFGP